MTTVLNSSSDPEMYVTKRNSHREIMSFDKILKRIKKVCHEANIKINCTSLTMKVIDQLYDGISTTKIDELTAEQCASLASTHPDYNTLAGRISISNHHKNIKPSFFQAMKDLYHYKDKRGQNYPMISHQLYKTIQSFGKDKVDAICQFDRDFLIDYFGCKTLEKSYLMRINKRIVERPQHMWLRVAFGIHDDNWDDVVETYTYMSKKYFTHATPTLFNAGTPFPQLSSCYLMAMEDDSIDGIFNTLKDCASISKWAGGIGLHIHNIRATGSQIRGTNGVSNGIVPMLRVFNNTAKYVDQGGGKRNGSFAIYLEPWHADVEMFLQMRKNHGDEELKARDLFYALWVPDLFMKRVKQGLQWTLMCPAECPGLADVVGDDFEALYEKYETEGKGRKAIPARDLWFQILDAQMETGTPYLLFKDAANKKSNQQNVGVIKSSNLCVSPDTFILTSEGHFPIYSLWPGNYPTGSDEQEKHKHTNIWNGSEFSKVQVMKTGTDVSFLEVHTSDGACLTCTPYHKFFIRSGMAGQITETEAINLLPGDLLESSLFPVIDGPERFQPEEIGIQLGCESGIKNVTMNISTSKTALKSIFVPVNYTIQCKMEWFCGFIEPYLIQLPQDFSHISITSVSRIFLEDLKYMMQTCGFNTVLRYSETENQGEWILNRTQFRLLQKSFGHLMKFHTYVWELDNDDDAIDVPPPNVRIVSVVPSLKKDDSYCFSEPKAHAGIFNGIRTSQCTEIIEYSDENETAVCNLASIALPAFVRTSLLDFDFEELHKVTRIITKNLNKIIDINFYPTPKTEKSNLRHRPIGLGVQGLADVFFMLNMSFTSDTAKLLNKRIFETIYHAALEESCFLAEKFGPYETFPGSPASKGILQFDMWNAHPGNGLYDWDELKLKIKTHGLRNSLLVAPMPTASTSQILGYNECIEPITSNIYSRRTMAGEFILVNKYLMQEMIGNDSWNETFKNNMIIHNGSIQNMKELSPEIREKYRTVWEIPMKDLIDMAADRGAFICQSQSLNLWMEDPNYNTMTSMHFYSWNKGLKTGIYYLRRRPRHQAQQFTIEPQQRNRDSKEDEGICESCSA